MSATNSKKTTNGIYFELNGWKYLSVKGTPKQLGYAHGFLMMEEFKKIKEMLNFNIYNNYGQPWDFFVDASKTHLRPTIEKNFPDLFEEMKGMADGCNAAANNSTFTNIDEILAWNNYFTITDSWYAHAGLGGSVGKEGGSADRCSAFIANGDYTTDGKIVVAHNSFTEFIDGQYNNVIIDISPDKGHRILMQTAACWIWSGTDFFVTSKGIVGTETTIGGFTKYENNNTIACRIRKAMQYGNTLKDYERILLDGNSGDYANSWLFGDTNTNEIMRIELGLKYHNTETTMNGCFIGFNATYDPRIRNIECTNSGFDDIRRHQGARRVILADLMEKYKGKIDINVAQEIIANHYDVYLNKENPCSRTVCSHYELDAREYMSDSTRPKPFQPRGAVDGCVADTELVKKMRFRARWGSSCGLAFNVKDFCNKHRQWKYLEPYLHDRPSEKWTEFSIHSPSKSMTVKRIKQPSKNTTSKRQRKVII